MATAPSSPDSERRERLLAVLADFVARGGVASLLAAPVKPGDEAFPEAWKPTRGGVAALLRRLAWHAGGLGERSVTITDERLGAPPTEHKPQTRVELTEVRQKELAFTLVFVGEDDVVGTLAHEIGVAYAALNRAEEADPYRTASEQQVIAIDQDRDLERGSIATVYLGLGVLAANAAFQQYSTRANIDAYQPHVYEVHRAGYVKMSDLGFLLAVQAVVRGESSAPPGLGGPQRDEVNAWIAALAQDDDAHALRARLGVGASDRGEARPKPVRFDDVLEDEEVREQRNGFRWATHRGGVGFIAGTALGFGIALAVATTEPIFFSLVFGGAAAGHVAGRGVRVIRCSRCATPIGQGAKGCPKCGAIMRGDIARLADRLEAEERLESD